MEAEALLPLDKLRGSAPAVLVFLLASSLLLVYFLLRRPPLSKGKFVYHGPHRWPIVKCLPALHRNRHRIFDWILENHNKYGTNYTLEIPGLRITFTTDPANVEHVLKTNFPNYPKGEGFQDMMGDLLGSGIFNSDGHMWRMQRKAASFEFSQNSLRELMLSTFTSQIHKELLPVLSDACQRDKQLDLQDVFSRYTLDSICHIGFGVHLGSLAPSFPKVPFAAAFDAATEVSCGRFLEVPLQWKLKRAFRLGNEREMAHARAVIDEFAYSVIKQRRQEMAQGLAEHKSDLLSRFMRLADESGGKHSDQFLRDSVLNFVLAGRDTTAVTMTWFFYMLSQHPRVQDAILHELAAIRASRSSDLARSTVHDDWTFEELKSMRYLHAALSETLRLFPAVPSEQKKVEANDVLPDGTFLPAGSQINWCPYAMGRREAIWGSDACQYRPERWLNSDGTLLQPSQFKFPAFQGGPRVCLGREMAYLQMKTVAAAIIPRFVLTPLRNHPVEYRVTLTLFMKHGLLAAVTKRGLPEP